MPKYSPAIYSPPTTYAEWSYCLDQLESGRDVEQVVEAIEDGSLSWTSGVAEQFAKRINHVFDSRLQSCSDKLNRDLSRGCDEATVVRAMIETRRMLMLLYRIATAPSFPETLSEHLVAELQRFAATAQQSLEQSAAADRQGHLAHAVRHHALTRFEQAAPDTVRPRANGNASAVSPRRRNILA